MLIAFLPRAYSIATVIDLLPGANSYQLSTQYYIYSQQKFARNVFSNESVFFFASFIKPKHAVVSIERGRLKSTLDFSTYEYLPFLHFYNVTRVEIQVNLAAKDLPKFLFIQSWVLPFERCSKESNYVITSRPFKLSYQTDSDSCTFLDVRAAGQYDLHFQNDNKLTANVWSESTWIDPAEATKKRSMSGGLSGSPNLVLSFNNSEKNSFEIVANSQGNIVNSDQICHVAPIKQCNYDQCHDGYLNPQFECGYNFNLYQKAPVWILFGVMGGGVFVGLVSYIVYKFMKSRDFSSRDHELTSSVI